MAYYNVKEFKANLNEIISELGISQNLKENPAFEVIIRDMLRQIPNADGNMENFDLFQVKDGNIKFEYTERISKLKHKIQINAPKPDQIRYESSIENHEQKEFLEINAVIDKFNFITQEINGATVLKTDNLEKCMCATSAEQKKFTSDGIMMEREILNFPLDDLNIEFGIVEASQALWIPQNAFNSSMIAKDLWNKKTQMTRNTFDTARVTTINKETGEKTHAVESLNREHGLQNMVRGLEDYSNIIEIMPMTKEEIDRIIEQEPNEKVKEGLRKYAKGRENYYYNSNEDPDFTYEQSSEGRSR